MNLHRKTRPPGAGTAGFTLIELIVTMLILSIMAGIAIYNFAGDRPGKNAKGAASMLYGEIQAFRMEALSKNTNYRFELGDGGSIYTVKQVDSAGNVLATVKTMNIQDEYPDIIFGALSGNPPDSLGNSIDPTDPVLFPADGSSPDDSFTIRVNGRFSKSGHLVLMPASSTKSVHQRLIVLSIVGQAKLYKWTGAGWK